MKGCIFTKQIRMSSPLYRVQGSRCVVEDPAGTEALTTPAGNMTGGAAVPAAGVLVCCVVC